MASVTKAMEQEAAVSLRSLLMPALSAYYLSEARLLRMRAQTESRRQRRSEPHEALYFHQSDDPYSALLVQVLPTLARRYGVRIKPLVVPPPEDSAAPDRGRLVAYSRRDAELLARRHGLDFADPGRQPEALRVAQANAALVRAVEQGDFWSVAPQVTQELWQPDARASESEPASESTTSAQLQQAQRLRKGLGHYLGGTLYYGGEWYWGIDRLHHLEARWQALGLGTGLSPLFAPELDGQAPQGVAPGQQIDFFFSLRSPYSAIAAPRIFRMGELSSTPVRLRYVLPMVMRGLPVPAEKRKYISLDAAREARLRGVPFGRINDPLGRPTERGLALMPLAESLGAGQRYVLSFMQGVWAEGLDAGSDRGLKTIAQRAGISWDTAQDTLHQDAQGQGGWRKVAEANRLEMTGLGLWGVPSFRVGDFSTWGQDRLWAVQQALMQGTVRPKA